MELPKTSPEQWAAVAAVVDHAGYAGAAEALDRSQSAVSYQVARLQEALGCRVLEVRGRRAVLTAHGEVLLQRARSLLGEWRALEVFAGSLAAGFEPNLRLVADAAFPRGPLLAALADLREHCPQTRVDLAEVVLSGAEEAIVDGAAAGTADLVITTRVPPGFLGDWLHEVEFVACAARGHPLHALGRTVARHDLEREKQVVLRDSGRRAPRDEGFLGAQYRWTVGSLEASLAIVEAGLAYAWLPRHLVAAALRDGRLLELRLEAGSVRRVPLYLVVVRPAEAGPATRAAAELLHAHVTGLGPRGRAEPQTNIESVAENRLQSAKAPTAVPSASPKGRRPRTRGG
jgi:DNA-binding transcriptional LysR family regulator